MAAEASTATGADLPEDVLFEIFSRVPNVIDLFHCAMACKRWLCLLADPAFLDRLHPAGNASSLLLGLFYQRRENYWPSKASMKRRMAEHSPPIFIPVPALGGASDLTSFVADEDGLFNHGTPLGSRRGHLLLMHLTPRTTDGKGAVLRVAVVNPITGARHVTPPLELECSCFSNLEWEIKGHAIITAGDADGSLNEQDSAQFEQLFIVANPTYLSDERQLHLHSYCASTRCWSAPTRFLATYYRKVGAGEAVVHGSQAYWLLNGGGLPHPCMVSAKVGTADVDVTELPATGTGSPFLCVLGDGGLSMACICKHTVNPIILVWTRQHRDPHDGQPPKKQWLRTRLIAIPEAPPDLSYPSIRGLEWFNLKGSALFALHRGEHDNLFIFDLETEVWEKVMTCRRGLLTSGFGGVVRCVSYEVDLLQDLFGRLYKSIQSKGGAKI